MDFGSGYSEEEQQQQQHHQMGKGKHPFSYSSSSSPSSTSSHQYKIQQQQQVAHPPLIYENQQMGSWLDNNKYYDPDEDNDASAAASDDVIRQPVVDSPAAAALELRSATSTISVAVHVDKEHMFDKVVTPSDVGKLNRLVIPKQHAERYFPLDSSTNEKGLLLNFEDRNGKLWRFRYSYWNSSQSYVMTKGWSRFVKEKKLDAGDIVSFQRGVGESGKDHLYIDWRRRPEAPDPASITNIQIQNHLLAQSMNWGSRLFPSLPPSVVSFPRNYEHLQQLNYGRFYPYQYHQQQQQHQQQVIGHGNYAATAKYYLTSPSGPVHIGAVQEGVVIDSVPVVHGKTAAKRLRLFGVNMECATQEESSDTLPSSSSVSPLQSRLSTGGSIAGTVQAEYSEKGKSSSLSFDLDL